MIFGHGAAAAGNAMKRRRKRFLYLPVGTERNGAALSL